MKYHYTHIRNYYLLLLFKKKKTELKVDYDNEGEKIDCKYQHNKPKFFYGTTIINA